MAFNWDFDTATLIAFISQIILLIVFMVKTSNTAKGALGEAKDAMKRANEAHDRITTQHGLHSLLREEVAKNYVDKELLREMEARMTSMFSRAIDGLSDRIDEALERTKRER